jgi:hypothetical protein
MDTAIRTRPSGSLGAIGLTLLLATSSAPVHAQRNPAPTPGAILCLLDWNTSFTASPVARLANQLALACTDARTIAWADHIEEAERSIAVMSSDDQLAAEMANSIAEWRRVLDMLNREQAHLAAEIKRSGSNPKAPSNARPSPTRESESRAAAVPPTPARNRTPVRFTVSPGYMPWAPAYLQEKLRTEAGFRNSVTAVSGTAVLRRADMETPLQSGTNVDLRAGDALATGPNGEVTISMDDGSKLSLGTSSEIVWSNSQPCVNSFSGFPQLIKGVLTWAGTGERLRKCPKAAETRDFGISTIGAAFTLKFGESNGRGVTTVVVKNGGVRVTDTFGAEVTVPSGTSKTFEHPLSPSMTLDDPIARAILDGKPLRRGDRWLVPIGAAAVWINADGWEISPEDPSAPDRRTFESIDGELSGALLYEPGIIEKDALAEMALSMVQRGAPDAKLIRKESRKVGALALTYIEIEATESGSAEVVVGEYFTGAQGTVALVVQLSKDIRADRQKEITALLDGLVSVSPFSLRAASR